jgi:hypothetical protein
MEEVSVVTSAVATIKNRTIASTASMRLIPASLRTRNRPGRAVRLTPRCLNTLLVLRQEHFRP